MAYEYSFRYSKPLEGILQVCSDIVFMAETLYPNRQRCKTCRKSFGTTVLDGLFCSYRCAGLPVPSRSVEDAPRHCKRLVNNIWGWKTKYTFEGGVPQKYRDDPSTNIYRCDYCHFLHIGHDRPAEVTVEQLSRTVRDMKTVGSVVRRYREQHNIDKKVLAKSLGIPVVRLTEIEDGDKSVSVVVLFLVLNKLGLTVQLTGR